MDTSETLMEVVGTAPKKSYSVCLSLCLSRALSVFVSHTHTHTPAISEDSQKSIAIALSNDSKKDDSHRVSHPTSSDTDRYRGS